MFAPRRIFCQSEEMRILLFLRNVGSCYPLPEVVTPPPKWRNRGRGYGELSVVLSKRSCQPRSCQGVLSNRSYPAEVITPEVGVHIWPKLSGESFLFGGDVIKELNMHTFQWTATGIKGVRSFYVFNAINIFRIDRKMYETGIKENVHVVDVNMLFRRTNPVGPKTPNMTLHISNGYKTVPPLCRAVAIIPAVVVAGWMGEAGAQPPFGILIIGTTQQPNTSAHDKSRSPPGMPKCQR